MRRAVASDGRQPEGEWRRPSRWRVTSGRGEWRRSAEWWHWQAAASDWDSGRREWLRAAADDARRSRRATRTCETRVAASNGGPRSPGVTGAAASQNACRKPVSDSGRGEWLGSPRVTRAAVRDGGPWRVRRATESDRDCQCRRAASDVGPRRVTLTLGCGNTGPGRGWWLRQRLLGPWRVTAGRGKRLRPLWRAVGAARYSGHGEPLSSFRSWVTGTCSDSWLGIRLSLSEACRWPQRWRAAGAGGSKRNPSNTASKPGPGLGWELEACLPDTLLDAASYGSRWVLLSPAPVAGVTRALRPRVPRPQVWFGRWLVTAPAPEHGPGRRNQRLFA